MKYIARYTHNGKRTKLQDDTLSGLKAQLVKQTNMPIEVFAGVTEAEHNRIIIFPIFMEQIYGIGRIQTSREHTP